MEEEQDESGIVKMSETGQDLTINSQAPTKSKGRPGDVVVHHVCSDSGLLHIGRSREIPSPDTGR